MADIDAPASPVTPFFFNGTAVLNGRLLLSLLRGLRKVVFELMFDSQNQDVTTPLVVVAGDIATIPKIDNEFTVIGHVGDRPAAFGLGGDLFDAVLYRLCGPLGCLWIFIVQKFPEPLKIALSSASDDYSWHSGAGFSSGLPQVSSQVSSASCVI